MAEKICPNCNGKGYLSGNLFETVNDPRGHGELKPCCENCGGTGIVALKTYYDPEGWPDEWEIGK